MTNILGEGDPVMAVKRSEEPTESSAVRSWRRAAAWTGCVFVAIGLAAGSWLFLFYVTANTPAAVREVHNLPDLLWYGWSSPIGLGVAILIFRAYIPRLASGSVAKSVAVVVSLLILAVVISVALFYIGQALELATECAMSEC